MRQAPPPAEKGRRRAPARLLRALLVVVLAGSVVALVALNGRTLYEKLNGQRIEVVRIEGNLQYVSRVEVERAVQVFENRSMVSVDLAEVKVLLEGHPWVREVSVRREWPDSLIVTVAEQVPIARWGERSLLNQNGEIFTPLDLRDKVTLPRLRGPQGREREVMEQYQKFNQILYPLGLRVAGLELDARGAWQFRLDNGVQVKVGKNRVMERMRRFAAFVEGHFARRMPLVETIDLRYSNGIAVDEREPEEEVVSL